MLVAYKGGIPFAIWVWLKLEQLYLCMTFYTNSLQFNIDRVGKIKIPYG